MVQSHQGCFSYKELSKLEGEKDSLTPTTTTSELEETKVLLVNLNWIRVLSKDLWSMKAKYFL